MVESDGNSSDGEFLESDISCNSGEEVLALVRIYDCGHEIVGVGEGGGGQARG